MAGRIDVTHQTAAQLPGSGTDLSDATHTRSFQTTMSDVGFGTVSLQNTDPLIANINYQDFVRFDLDSTARFLMLVENIDTTTRDAGEEHDQITTISGRGSVAQWEQGVVYPPNGVFGQPLTDTRIFGYPSKEIDITGWSTATQKYQQGTTPPLAFEDGGWYGYPLGWTDPDGYWIWSSSYMGDADAGTSYFATDYTVTVASGERPRYSLYVASDNGHKLWVDGVLVSDHPVATSRDSFIHAYRIDLVLTNGTHRITAEVTNAEPPPSGANLAGFIFAMFDQTVSGDDDTLVLRSDSSWKVLDYPTDPPGFTVGEVIRILLEEAQDDENTVLGWTLDFDDTDDSDGNAWPTDQSYTFRVGDDLLKVLRQLGETDIDWVADPSEQILYAYNIHDMGVAAGSATATLDNLGHLAFVGRG